MSWVAGPFRDVPQWWRRSYAGGRMDTQPSRTYYQVLMLDRSADADLVNIVYRSLARRYHPDLNPCPEARPRIIELNQAYCVLRDKERRARYDRQLGSQLEDWDRI